MSKFSELEETSSVLANVPPIGAGVAAIAPPCCTRTRGKHDTLEKLPRSRAAIVAWVHVSSPVDHLLKHQNPILAYQIRSNMHYHVKSITSWFLSCMDSWMAKCELLVQYYTTWIGMQSSLRIQDQSTVHSIWQLFMNLSLCFVAWLRTRQALRWWKHLD